METNLTLPTIRLKEEAGLLLLSALLKSLNPRWGNNNSQASRMVLDYFKFMPINPTFLTAIMQFQQAGLTEETLYQLALTYNHAERVDFILNYLHRQTSIPRDELRHHQELLLKTLAGFKLSLAASPLHQLFSSFNAKDTHARLEKIDQLKHEIEDVYRFFRIKPAQNEFIFTPSDPLFSEYIGHALMLSDSQVVFMTYNPEIKTQCYQVLRLILKPIVQKVLIQLSDEQKSDLFESASGKIRQVYGPNPEELLTTELISVYYNNFKAKKPVDDFEAFKARVYKLSDKEFLQSLETNHALRERCEYLGVRNLIEFKAALRQYYDLFFRDELSLKLYRAYQIYDNQQSNITFEQFSLINLPKML